MDGGDLALFVKRLRPEAAIMPRAAYTTDAGYDVYAWSDLVVPANRAIVYPLGFAAALPAGTCAVFHNKSGLAKEGIIASAGADLIDEGYRGEWHVHLRSFVPEDTRFRYGDKIAQFVITPYVKPTVITVNELDETDRGAGGFGSTTGR